MKNIIAISYALASTIFIFNNATASELKGPDWDALTMEERGVYHRNDMFLKDLTSLNILQDKLADVELFLLNYCPKDRSKLKNLDKDLQDKIELFEKKKEDIEERIVPLQNNIQYYYHDVRLTPQATLFSFSVDTPLIDRLPIEDHSLLSYYYKEIQAKLNDSKSTQQDLADLILGAKDNGVMKDLDDQMRWHGNFDQIRMYIIHLKNSIDNNIGLKNNYIFLEKLNRLVGNLVQKKGDSLYVRSNQYFLDNEGKYSLTQGENLQTLIDSNENGVGPQKIMEGLYRLSHGPENVAIDELHTLLNHYEEDIRQIDFEKKTSLFVSMKDNIEFFQNFQLLLKNLFGEIEVKVEVENENLDVFEQIPDDQDDALIISNIEGTFLTIKNNMNFKDELKKRLLKTIYKVSQLEGKGFEDLAVKLHKNYSPLLVNKFLETCDWKDAKEIRRLMKRKTVHEREKADFIDMGRIPHEAGEIRTSRKNRDVIDMQRIESKFNKVMKCRKRGVPIDASKISLILSEISKYRENGISFDVEKVLSKLDAIIESGQQDHLEKISSELDATMDMIKRSKKSYKSNIVKVKPQKKKKPLKTRKKSSKRKKAPVDNNSYMNGQNMNGQNMNGQNMNGQNMNGQNMNGQNMNGQYMNYQNMAQQPNMNGNMMQQNMNGQYPNMNGQNMNGQYPNMNGQNMNGQYPNMNGNMMQQNMNGQYPNMNGQYPNMNGQDPNMNGQYPNYQYPYYQ